MIKFNLKSAYHHVPILQGHQKYMGVEWEGKYYCFAALTFSLATAPFLFNTSQNRLSPIGESLVLEQ